MAVGKRADTYGFYPLNSRFPLFVGLAQTRDRRPLRKGERQRILSTVGAHNVRPFLYLYAVSDFVLLHRRVHLRRRDITVSRNSLVGGCGRHLQATIINKLYRRVRRPRRTACKFICTRAIVGEYGVLSHQRQPDADKRFCRCMIHFCFKI